jgi:ABC-type multidrug transport system ATPase subunit
MTEAAPPPTLELDRVGIAYPDQTPLARDWSATLVPGITLLFGDTGSGKTTLLRVLAGEQRASGRLVLDGVDLDRDERAYRDRVCWLASADDAHEQTVVGALPAVLGADEALWATHAQAFALGPHLAKPLYMLSTGSRRKVWLATALATRRALLLLDEPTGALDAPSIAHLMRALAEAAERRERIVVVASSQDLPETIALSERIELPIQGATLTR